jgi:alpha-galactosidase
MKLSWKMRLYPTLCASLLVMLSAGPSTAQTAQIFRLDGGDSTYAFGVNERDELQTLYWGGRVGAHDSIPAAHSLPEWASFDSPATTTPQEYAGWGAGLFTEPALKVSFADGNRDLVLHFVKATSTDPNAIDLLLKDISREIYVTLHYSMDPESGILGRSASIENREKQPVMIEQAAAAQWTLPPARYTLNYLTSKAGAEQPVIRLIRGLRSPATAARPQPDPRSRMRNMVKSGSARWRGQVRGGLQWRRVRWMPFG